MSTVSTKLSLKSQDCSLLFESYSQLYHETTFFSSFFVLLLLFLLLKELLISWAYHSIFLQSKFFFEVFQNSTLYLSCMQPFSSEYFWKLKKAQKLVPNHKKAQFLVIAPLNEAEYSATISWEAYF